MEPCLPGFVVEQEPLSRLPADAAALEALEAELTESLNREPAPLPLKEKPLILMDVDTDYEEEDANSAHIPAGGNLQGANDLHQASERATLELGTDPAASSSYYAAAYSHQPPAQQDMAA